MSTARRFRHAVTASRVATRFLRALVDEKKLVPNPNPDGKKEMVTPQYAEKWEIDHAKGKGKPEKKEEPKRETEEEILKKVEKAKANGATPQDIARMLFARTGPEYAILGRRTSYSMKVVSYAIVVEMVTEYEDGVTGAKENAETYQDEMGDALIRKVKQDTGWNLAVQSLPASKGGVAGVAFVIRDGAKNYETFYKLFAEWAERHNSKFHFDPRHHRQFI